MNGKDLVRDPYGFQTPKFSTVVDHADERNKALITYSLISM